ncbi:hypothetical protein NMY22_g13959 [Coprinellus aureogranulatus]|nr:hypothetical protein NMY22_g13959 [Coprinellus aureogranulatus]
MPAMMPSTHLIPMGAQLWALWKDVPERVWWYARERLREIKPTLTFVQLPQRLSIFEVTNTTAALIPRPLLLVKVPLVQRSSIARIAVSIPCREQRKALGFRFMRGYKTCVVETTPKTPSLQLSYETPKFSLEDMATNARPSAFVLRTAKSMVHRRLRTPKRQSSRRRFGYASPRPCPTSVVRPTHQRSKLHLHSNDPLRVGTPSSASHKGLYMPEDAFANFSHLMISTSTGWRTPPNIRRTALALHTMSPTRHSALSASLRPDNTVKPFNLPSPAREHPEIHMFPHAATRNRQCNGWDNGYAQHRIMADPHQTLKSRYEYALRVLAMLYAPSMLLLPASSKGEYDLGHSPSLLTAARLLGVSAAAMKLYLRHSQFPLSQSQLASAASTFDPRRPSLGTSESQLFGRWISIESQQYHSQVQLDPVSSDIPLEKWNAMEWHLHLLQYFPLRSIPHKLQLVPGKTLQPPRFVYGWAMSHTTLHQISKNCHFSQPFDDVGSVDYTEATLALNRVLNKQFPDIMKDLKWVFVTAVVTKDQTVESCIALVDSYIRGNRKPTPEQIQTLRQFFGIGEGSIQTLADNEPMWWIDWQHGAWTYQHSDDVLKKARPWALAKKRRGQQ